MYVYVYVYNHCVICFKLIECYISIISQTWGKKKRKSDNHLNQLSTLPGTVSSVMACYYAAHLTLGLGLRGGDMFKMLKQFLK